MKIIIIGGAGFIGVNTSDYFLNKGYEVSIVDNLYRYGSERNLEWLRSRHKFSFYRTDIRDFQQLKDIFAANKDADAVLHFAAQVAVTTSVHKPMEDFEINALGTINLLESIRLNNIVPVVIYASTNKVYGGMENLKIVMRDKHYQFKDLPEGISEEQQLDFHSPYGCSKGAADQYVRDYYRIYGIPTTVLRQSCIYGINQYGVEDQGWVAWFTIAAALKKKITIYGDGKQVRDVLFIDDLIKAYEMVLENKEKTAGKIYNVGGGPKHRMSLHDLISLLEELSAKRIDFSYSDWRPGDQPVYISNIDKIEKEIGWLPKTDIDKGVKILFEWVNQNHELFKHL